MKKAIKNKGPGAPKKRDNDKKSPRGLTHEQEEFIKQEASIRNVSENFVLREAVEWYKTAKETKRGDVSASELFDDKLTTPSE